MINLLPPQYKDKIREAKKIRIAFNFGIFVIICLMILWLSFVFINSRIDNMKEVQAFLVVAEKTKIKQLEEIKAKIGTINGMISEINKFYNNQVALSDILIQLSNVLNREAELDNFSFNKTSGQVVISGTVQTLKGLNELKDILNSQSNFRDVNLIIPSYVPKEDITFKVDFFIKK